MIIKVQYYNNFYINDKSYFLRKVMTDTNLLKLPICIIMKHQQKADFLFQNYYRLTTKSLYFCHLVKIQQINNQKLTFRTHNKHGINNYRSFSKFTGTDIKKAPHANQHNSTGMRSTKNINTKLLVKSFPSQ